LDAASSVFEIIFLFEALREEDLSFLPIFLQALHLKPSPDLSDGSLKSLIGFSFLQTLHFFNSLFLILFAVSFA